MLRTPKSVLLLGVVLLGAACDRVPTGSSDDRPEQAPVAGPSFYTSPKTICSTQSVPSGYVILAGRSEPTCSGYYPGSYNAYFIGIPGTQEWVCHISPIPSGYVIVSSNRDSSCPGYANSFNRYLIKKPGYEETVCNASPIPSNYTVIYTTNEPSCPYYTPGGSNAKRIRRL